MSTYEKKRKAFLIASQQFIGAGPAKAVMAFAEEMRKLGKVEAEEEEPEEEEDEDEESSEEEDGEETEEEEESSEEEEEEGEEAESFEPDDEDEEEETPKKGKKGKPGKSSKSKVKIKEEEEEEGDDIPDEYNWSKSSFNECQAQLKTYGGKAFFAKIASYSDKKKKHKAIITWLHKLEPLYGKLSKKYNKSNIDAALKKYKVKTTAKDLTGKVTALTCAQVNFK